MTPTDIQVRKKSRLLRLTYGDQACHEIPFELLRVWSPSAEVRGHGQDILQTGKRDVMVEDLEMVGNYALKIRFSDGHDTGLFSWSYLWQLGEQQDQYWTKYLERLEAEGGSRD